MAEVRSLDVHTPVALPYLIKEGILPQDPERDLYQWETYVFQAEHEDVEEEVLATKQCVVWSRGKFIQKVYRFEVEGEGVAQAILTQFPSVHAASVTIPDQQGNDTNVTKPDSQMANTQSSPSHESATGRRQEPGAELSGATRALVVFLTTKAHIYFHQGSNYIVDLPVEVEKVFSAPCGVVIQRKQLQGQLSSSSLQLPGAPPNSFLSSQFQQSQSFLHSPSFVKSLSSTQPLRPSPLSGNKRLDALLQGTLESLGPSDEDFNPFYTLTSPLLEFGAVTFSWQHQKPRLSTKSQPGLSVEFESLDPAEHLIYVSPTDELSDTTSKSRAPFMLMVTANSELRTLTIWHAWYLDEKSLSSLMRQRAAHKAAKARRRSSFLSASAGTGTATPAVRQREGTRESLATAGSIRVPGEPAASNATNASSRKPTRQEEEEAMASQMDPDYQPTVSQPNARESRRISSLNTDVRASHTTANASFAGPAGRRNTSFGGAAERRSFGHRRSRGSTPGSTFSRSLGPEDDLMDIDGSLDADEEENIDSIVRHVRATFEVAGADSMYGDMDEDFRRDLIVRKIHSLPMAGSKTSPRKAVSAARVVTLRDDCRPEENEDQRLNVYILDATTKSLSCLRLLVKQRALFATLDDSTHIPVPIVLGDTKLGHCQGIAKLRDNLVNAVLLANVGLILSVHDDAIYPLPGTGTHERQDASQTSATDIRIRENGGDRNVEASIPGLYSVQNNGITGRFDEVADNGVNHRKQVQLSPNNLWVYRLLDVCRLTLPAQQASKIRALWVNAQTWLSSHVAKLDGATMHIEWIAFATSVLAFGIHLLDENTRAALNSSGILARQGSVKDLKTLKRRSEGLSSRQSPWRAITVDLSATQSSQDSSLLVAANLAHQLVQSSPGFSAAELSLPAVDIFHLMLAFHIFSEEQRLYAANASHQNQLNLAAVIVQLGDWLRLPEWSFSRGQYYELEGANEQHWLFTKNTGHGILDSASLPLMPKPIGVFQWFEHTLQTRSQERYPTIDTVTSLRKTSNSSEMFRRKAASMTPRITILSNILEATSGFTVNAVTTVQVMAQNAVTPDFMESLPTAIAVPFKEAIARCENNPPTTWSSGLLRLVRRDDLELETVERHHFPQRPTISIPSAPKDVQSVCNALEHHPHSFKTKEADRHAVSQLIFNEDRRLLEATSLMHFNSPQVAECPKQPDWSDADHLERQKRLMLWATVRMTALPAGDGMIHYDSQTPLLTDKYHLSGFSNSCVMQPMGNTMTTDRSGLTEEKVAWAYFHAGVSVGLRISQDIKGIDTSWIAFNKPNELTNRHAGLLLALGLGGHLRHTAKWLSFKYLTPKHTMTSVGLLLGLSASYMGSMDGLITRMLSVHITRMLPPGAAELNISPVTQTAGLMGIGLLYYDTQHRRMSEIMLSEIEYMELEDPDSGPDPLRDESYRLSAGFALGFINLGRGKDLRGLHGMHLPERLLAFAVGSRPVNAVHVFDRATAGAVVAVALVYMKSNDRAIASKIDIPDTEPQFDHVRPDVLMLRVMAKHVILWDDIGITEGSSDVTGWIQRSLPKCFSSRFLNTKTASGFQDLKTSDVPFYNIVTGLAWALSLKYAGSGNERARDEILKVLDTFYQVAGSSGARIMFNYDSKLARSTVRRCTDVLALAAATVMAGTGDLKTFRYLRRLHGRVDSETPYGSHLAAHLAIGVLFLGGGTYTFGTSDLAIASLICAFYPLYPTDVHDNYVHLQAFRHFWVFAAEARCLVVEDIDTKRPISMPILLTLRNGATNSLTAPCLIPELNTVSTIQTNDPTYWRVTLDFVNNPSHLRSFKLNQRILVRKCPASEAHSSTFLSTLAALNSAESSFATSTPGSQAPDAWQSLFNLPAFEDLDKADLELILPPDVHSSIYTDHVGTVVDDRLELKREVEAGDRHRLWDVRSLFAWAAKAGAEGNERLKWIGEEVVDVLKARVEERRKIVDVQAEL